MGSLDTKHPDVSGIRLRLADRTVTPEEVATMLATDPAKAGHLLRGGVRIEAGPAVLVRLRTTPIGPFLGDDGTVEASADFGAFLGGLVLGFCIGVLVGVAIDDMVKSTDTSTDDSTDDGGTTHDNGETGDTGSGGSGDGGTGGEGGSGS